MMSLTPDSEAASVGDPAAKPSRRTVTAKYRAAMIPSVQRGRPNAVIDSVHPEESLEVLREGMSGFRMMAQTIFLAKDKATSADCVLDRSET
jgi:hypothetical protein